MTEPPRLVDASGHVVEEPVLPIEPLPVAVVPEVPAGTTSSQTVTTSTGPTSAGWMSRNLRNTVVIALTSMTCYLAWAGEEQARMALITSFTLLAGSLFGERAALKTPGKDS